MIEGVHIWRAALDEPGWPGSGELSAQERERAAGFLREDVRRRWATSRWALRRVLERYLEVPAPEIVFAVGEHGKPRLATGAGPRFNLSHSQGLALVAVAEREVGIDLEAIRPGRDLVALAERALPPEQAAAVRAAAPLKRPSLFYAAWVRHEARLKCLGVGLGAAPPEARVAVEDIDVASGYAAAVAVAGDEVAPLLCRSLRAG